MVVIGEGSVTDIVRPFAAECEALKEAEFVEGEDVLSFEIGSIEVLQFGAHGDIIIEMETGFEYRYTGTHEPTLAFEDVDVGRLIHEHGIEPPAFGNPLIEFKVNIGVVLPFFS